jgi:hypothetical protein
VRLERSHGAGSGSYDLTFVDLRDARPGGLRAAADAWRELAADLVKLRDRVVDEVTGPVRRSGWEGDAAAAAFGVFDRLDDEYEVAAVQIGNASALMREAAAQFEDVQRRLLSAVDTATNSLGLIVDGDGRVRAPRPTEGQLHDPDGIEAHRLAQTNARIYDELLARIVEEAAQLDLRFSTALRDFSPSFVGQQVRTEYNDASDDARGALGLMGLSESDIPRPGTAPAEVARWWSRLSAEAQAMLLTAYPGSVGALDGLAAVDRDEANRLALRNLLGEPDRRTSSNDSDDPQYVRLVDLSNRLEAAEYAPVPKRLYLLGLDNQGDGQAIVAVGNPDIAGHAAVLVPGVGTELDDMFGQIDRASIIRDTSDAMTTDAAGDVAVIAWLGYDTPSLDPNEISDIPGFGDEARQGSRDLDRFVDGLRTSHEGAVHLSVVGHSYGSVVSGHAAGEGGGIAADDLVVLGSPGLRADHADDLSMGPSHVWAGAAPDDHVANPELHAPWYSGIPIIGPFLPGVEDRVHGTSPHREEFGAISFHTDTTGHSGYWDPNSESLRNQARIVVGQYDRVSVDHGTPPL